MFREALAKNKFASLEATDRSTIVPNYAWVSDLMVWILEPQAELKQINFGQGGKGGGVMPKVSFFYRTQVQLGFDLWVWMSLTDWGCWGFSAVTLADEDANSKLSDNAIRVIQGRL